MNGVQTRFKCKLDVKRCKRFVFPPSSLLPRSNALKTKAIRYFQTDRTLTRIVSPPLQHALRNRYTLEVYEQTNHLFNFPVRLILALHNYDITIHEQDKQTALQQINEVCNDFQTMRKQLEETYSQTRFMEQPDGYIADQNHHNHLAAKTNNSDWWYYYEIPMIRKTRTWMNSQTARQKNIP